MNSLTILNQIIPDRYAGQVFFPRNADASCCSPAPESPSHDPTAALRCESSSWRGADVARPESPEKTR